MTLTATDLAAELIRFDTINPPGQEQACTERLAALLTAARICVRDGAAGRRPAQSRRADRWPA